MSDIQKNLESTSEFQKKSELEIKSDHNIKLKEMDVSAGFIGKLFGSKENAPTYITGVLLVLFSISAIFFIPDNKNIWAMITLCLGYMFGKNR